MSTVNDYTLACLSRTLQESRIWEICKSGLTRTKAREIGPSLGYSTDTYLGRRWGF